MIIFKGLILFLIVLGFALYLYIQLSKLYKSIVNKRGVRFEGTLFDVDNMPTIEDEAMNELMNEGLGV